MHETRFMADKHAVYTDRVACVEVKLKVKKGEGLK